MSEENTEMRKAARAPVLETKTGRSFSIIWVVPLVALLIGGWLALKSWSEKGPVITITFETVEGLEVDKTKIKFNDVEIGLVTDIELSDDLSAVIVTAEMKKDASKYMREHTQFWVVRARVAAGEVSGLGTLFSGVYIGCYPSKEGKPVSAFKGLEKPPIVTSRMPGQHFLLAAANLGSLDIGSPVYYRGIKVGQVVAYGFDEQAESVNVRVFVNAPYHEKVRQNTHFWNASGIDFKLDTEGVRVAAQSLVTIMLGGVAFDLPGYLEPAAQAEEDSLFPLYKRQEDSEERTYLVKHNYLMNFKQNVRGLVPGAPVEMRGIRIGEVVDVKLEVNMENNSARVAVLAVIEPERIGIATAGKFAGDAVEKLALAEDLMQNMSLLVNKGLRAQLKTDSLLTGQLYVDLDFYPDAPPMKITQQSGYQVMPTMPAPLEQLAQRVNNILLQIEKIPLAEIGQDLHETIKTLQRTLTVAEQVAGGIDQNILPEVKSALKDFQVTMSGIEETFGPGSTLNYGATQVLSEMETTIRSLRALIDYLERNPQAVIFGKEEAKE